MQMVSSLQQQQLALLRNLWLFSTTTQEHEKGLQTWSGPEVKGAREAMRQSAAAVRAEAACEVAQVRGTGIPNTLLTHPHPCTKTATPLSLSDTVTPPTHQHLYIQHLETNTSALMRT